MEGGVACAGGGVAFEGGLVEEEVYYFVCTDERTSERALARREGSEDGSEVRQMVVEGSCDRMEAGGMVRLLVI